jgi:threonine aldolase
VICSTTAHVETDECGAPEFFSNGAKLLTAATADGKLTPDAICALALNRTDIHYPKPRVVTLTQATETGLVYTAEEIAEISELCRELGLKLHMDGARFSNAVATLDCAPADISWRAGVDALCFGGAKNGLALGEAVIFFDTALARDFEYRCKQAGQLASKMRFLSAPWLNLLESGAWLRNARHGNSCARKLAERLKDVAGVTVQFPVEANAVFLNAPEPVLEALREKGWRFYTFIGGAARFMFAWDAEVTHVEALAKDIAEAARANAPDA